MFIAPDMASACSHSKPKIFFLYSIELMFYRIEQWLENVTVHFILVCQMLFGDNFFIRCNFQLKLTRYVSTFFVCSQKQNFSWIQQKTQNFPIDLHCKIAHFDNVMSIDMLLPKWAFFTMEVYGEISHFGSDPAEISFLIT